MTVVVTKDRVIPARGTSRTVGITRNFRIADGKHKGEFGQIPTRNLSSSRGTRVY